MRSFREYMPKLKSFSPFEIWLSYFHSAALTSKWVLHFVPGRKAIKMWLRHLFLFWMWWGYRRDVKAPGSVGWLPPPSGPCASQRAERMRSNTLFFQSLCGQTQYGCPSFSSNSWTLSQLLHAVFHLSELRWLVSLWVSDDASDSRRWHQTGVYRAWRS